MLLPPAMRPGNLRVAGDGAAVERMSPSPVSFPITLTPETIDPKWQDRKKVRYVNFE